MESIRLDNQDLKCKVIELEGIRIALEGEIGILKTLIGELRVEIRRIKTASKSDADADSEMEDNIEQ